MVSIARIERPPPYRGGSASTETMPAVSPLPFQSRSLSPQGWGLIDLPLRASNEGLLRPRVARAQKDHQPPSPPLFCEQEERSACSFLILLRLRIARIRSMPAVSSHTIPIRNRCADHCWPTVATVIVTWFVFGNNREIRSVRAQSPLGVSPEENV